jgi:hypothetical protein
MRASFRPSILEIAILVGWTACNAFRDRVDRLRGGLSSMSAAAVEEGSPHLTVATLPRPVRDYSIN